MKTNLSKQLCNHSTICLFFVLFFCFLLITGCDSKDHTGEAKTPSGSRIQHGRGYQEVVEDFTEHGFTNIKTEPIEDLILGLFTKDGEVEDVSVGGDTEYSPDKWVPADTEVIIRYHTFPSKETDSTESTSSSSTKTEESINDSDLRTTEESSTKEESSSIQTVDYHSSHNKEVAVLGNSGIYAYKNNGSSYETYFIIDFDAEVVYSFNVGNGDVSGDIGTIISGDLNTHIEVSYQTYDASYIMGISFYTKNRPDHVIVQDSYGNEFDFYTTNLDSALSLKNKYSFPD